MLRAVGRIGKAEQGEAGITKVLGGGEFEVYLGRVYSWKSIYKDYTVICGFFVLIYFKE